MISTMATKIFKKTAILLLWVAVWQVLSMIIGSDLLIPSPLNTVSALISLAKTSDFYLSVLISLLRIITGFALGVLFGFLCGILTAKSNIFKEITAPLMQIIKAVPVASFIILAFFWFDSSILPIFISFLMVVPIIWSSTETALLNIDPKYIEMGEVFRLSKSKIFFKIKLPLIFPSFISAALTSLGFAWKSGIAAEVIAKPLNSLGNMLEKSKTHLEIAEVFALTVVVALLSLLLEVSLKKIFRRYRDVKA
jgi:NitT/TauT family transport system permease protein